jgi:hypothetical protein
MRLAGSTKVEVSRVGGKYLTSLADTTDGVEVKWACKNQIGIYLPAVPHVNLITMVDSSSSSCKVNIQRSRLFSFKLC